MKYKKFDVVKLKNNDRATILNVNKNDYLAEIVNADGITLDKKYITDNDIKIVMYKKELKRNL